MPIILGKLLLIAFIGYIWGSIPSGYWMGMLMRGRTFDIRTYGSHKTGATNVLRTLGKTAAVIVFVSDISKGVGPALLTTFVPFFSAAGWGPGVACLAALLGHCYPVFIGFKGGRGVSTASGSILILSPLTFLFSAITLFSSIVIWRYVSLGSIVAAATSMVCGVTFYLVGRVNPLFIGRVSLPVMLFLVIGPGLIILFHYDNIGRIRAGTERKLGQKVRVEESSSSSASSSSPSSTKAQA
jgi:acyl phosphate:glycerol-3-phosphate acyltransferase